MIYFYYVLMWLFILVCLLMIGLVLIQKGRGGGMSSAFGGGGGNTAFGTKTGDVLTWATSIVFALFIVILVAMNLTANKINTPPAVQSSAPTLPMSPGNSPSSPGK
jgi:preprotein translocase subunit SecG